MTLGWSSVTADRVFVLQLVDVGAEYLAPGGSHFMANGVFSDTGRTAQIS